MVDKLRTNIEGFDEITRGGIPRGRTTLIMGAPGCGKTVFALQTLVNLVQAGETAIFVAFEERPSAIQANVSSFGWNLEEYLDKSLFFIDARLSRGHVQGGRFDLGGLLASISALAKAKGASVIALDAVDMLLMNLNDPLAERQELNQLHSWLLENEFTTLISHKIDTHEFAQAKTTYGFLQYLVDCVVHLDTQMNGRIVQRELRVVKYRGSGFAENTASMIIGKNGIQIVNSGPIDLNYTVFSDRVSTGVQRLNAMLDGGYLRGSSTLITGSPGTAKTTLCGAFVEATCLHGGRALYVSFDESANEIVRNLASVNINLAAHQQAGRLLMFSARTEARSAELHLMHIQALMDEHKPDSLIIDPLSALIKAGGQSAAISFTQRLFFLAKARGITIVCTSLLDSSSSHEATDIQISTMADTWIHLSYQINAGERNRALTIVKARGTRHSSQVRELVLENDGITLADVYTAGGEVLMGTMRWEKELEEKRERELFRRRNVRQQQEIAQAEAEVQARIELLQQELMAQRLQLEYLTEEQSLREQYWQEKQEQVRTIRRADDRKKYANDEETNN